MNPSETMSERNERLYTEKEVARILQRAADLQSEVGGSDPTARGSSRLELQRVGEELGIEPAFVAQALAELNLDGVDEDHRAQSRWLGAPPEYVVERTIVGPLSPQAWDAIVGHLNSEFKQSIPGVESGEFRTWQWKHELGWVHFSAIPSGATVRLRMVLHIDDGLVAGLVPTGIAWFALASLLFANDALRPWLSILCSAAAFIGLGAAFRTLSSRWWRQDQRKTARLMNRILDAFEEVPVVSPMLAAEEQRVHVTPEIGP